MPTLKVMTWNSRGESPAKAAFLQNLILHNQNFQNWYPDVIAIQEAAVGGGPIAQMLNGLGVQLPAVYANYPPTGANVRGELNLLKLSNSFTAVQPLQSVALATDPGSVAAAAQTGIAPFLTQQMRYPARADVLQCFGGRQVNFMTWHTDTGPGPLPGISAAVNYAAYWLLQSSNYYTTVLNVPPANGISIIAGDLNAYAADLANPTGIPTPQRILPNWFGVSNNLDHIVARTAIAKPTFPNAGHYSTGGLSDHDVFVSEVIWP